jgi:hypothetical protein
MVCVIWHAAQSLQGHIHTATWGKYGFFRWREANFRFANLHSQRQIFERFFKIWEAALPAARAIS